MASKYVVLTDSCSDLSLDLVERYKLDIFPMEYILDNVSYRDKVKEKDLELDEFYRRISSGSIGSTSQISPIEFETFFEKYVSQGIDILYIGFSSGLSGTYQNAVLAKNTLLEKYKSANIICVDTLLASFSEGKLVVKACKNKEKGLSLEDNAKDIESKKMNVAVWFTVDDLNCLKRGGRVKPSAAFIGTLLNIKPVLHMNEEGKLIPMSKARGRKASLIELLKHFKEDALDLENDEVYIASALSKEDEEFLAKHIKELGVKHITFSSIGPVIGMHSGPKTILISYYAKKR